MTVYSSPPPPRTPQFRQGLILDRLLEPAVRDRVNNYSLMKMTGRADPSKVKRLYAPADVRMVRRALGVLPDHGRSGPPVVVLRSLRRRSGKTTLAANVAGAAAFMGWRVLCIDADPQADLSTCLGTMPAGGVLPSQFAGALVRYLQYGAPVSFEDAVVPVFADGMLDLLPGALEIAEVETMLTQREGAGALLRKLVEVHDGFFARYDLVLVDCAPGDSRLAAMFSTSARLIVAPVRPDQASLVAAAALGDALGRLPVSPFDAGMSTVAVVNGLLVADPALRAHLRTLAVQLQPWPIDEVAVPLCGELEWAAAAAKGLRPDLVVEVDPFGNIARLFYELAASIWRRCLRSRGG